MVSRLSFNVQRAQRQADLAPDGLQDEGEQQL